VRLQVRPSSTGQRAVKMLGKVTGAAWKGLSFMGHLVSVSCGGGVGRVVEARMETATTSEMGRENESATGPCRSMLEIHSFNSVALSRSPISIYDHERCGSRARGAHPR
jgi:hypothetical protein